MTDLSAEIKVNYHKIDWCDSLNGSTVEAFRRLLQEQIRPTLILASDVVSNIDAYIIYYGLTNRSLIQILFARS